METPISRPVVSQEMSALDESVMLRWKIPVVARRPPCTHRLADPTARLSLFPVRGIGPAADGCVQTTESEDVVSVPARRGRQRFS
jgi:hypothetical protein